MVSLLSGASRLTFHAKVAEISRRLLCRTCGLRRKIYTSKAAAVIVTHCFRIESVAKWRPKCAIAILVYREHADMSLAAKDSLSRIEISTAGVVPQDVANPQYELRDPVVGIQHRLPLRQDTILSPLAALARCRHSTNERTGLCERAASAQRLTMTDRVIVSGKRVLRKQACEANSCRQTPSADRLACCVYWPEWRRLARDTFSKP